MEEERQFQPGQQYLPGPNRFTFFAGVIMPAISITVEATTHICAEVFFDPIPTIWHLLLVIFVPLAQIQVWFAIRRRADRSTCARRLSECSHDRDLDLLFNRVPAAHSDVTAGASLWPWLVAAGAVPVAARQFDHASSTETSCGHSSSAEFCRQGKRTSRRFGVDGRSLSE